MSEPRPAKPFFPAALLLENRLCLVVGGGRVALRKAAKLAESGARVQVVAPSVEDALKLLPGVGWSQRPYQARDLDGVFLAFAATDDPAVNRLVLAQCRERGILCSAADAHWPEGDLILPASFTEDGLTVSVSTSGNSCRRSRLLRENLGRHVRFLGDLDLLMTGLDHSGSDLEALESLKAARPEIEALLSALWGVHEFMVLDTCNRFEVIALASASTAEPIARFLGRIAGVGMPLQSITGIDAFQRLAEIAAGLRAQALGETRIVAQLKEALAEAQRKGHAGSGLQGWTDTALHLSKAIRNAAEPHLASLETEDLVEQYLAAQGLAGERMLLVGRGAVGQGLARRFPKAVQIGGRSDEELRARLPGARVVLCATGSPSFVLGEPHRGLLRPDAVLIDLSLPRNIAPGLPGVVGLNELRATVPPATAEALAEVVRTVVQEHLPEFRRLVDLSGPGRPASAARQQSPLSTPPRQRPQTAGVGVAAPLPDALPLAPTARHSLALHSATHSGIDETRWRANLR